MPRSAQAVRPRECRACRGSSLTTALEVTRDGSRHLFLGCSACGSLSLGSEPAFEDIERAHGAGRYHGELRRKFPSPIERSLELLQRRRAAWLAHSLRPHARILDVGCGRGVMAAELQARGFDVIATEVNAGAAEGAVRRGVRTVLTGPAALDTLEAGSLDAVSLFHSLEHLVDPPGTLRQLARLLAPHGQLFVEVPLLSRLARAFGAAWFHLDPPRHTVLFTRAGIQRATVDAGLRLLEEHPFSVEFSAPSLFLSALGPRFGSDGLYAAAHITSPGWLRRVGSVGLIVAGSCAALVPAVVLASIGEGDIFRARFEATST